MNIDDIKKCADCFKTSFLETFYILTTYSGKCFLLVANKNNFPHSIGVPKDRYQSNGYKSGSKLFDDIIQEHPISKKIIPEIIVPNSKMYNKCKNYQEVSDLFWKNNCLMVVNFDPTLSTSRLDSVDILVTDIYLGYSLGWVFDCDININAYSKLKKYCISTRIDENEGKLADKEKYLPKQDIDILKEVIALNQDSVMIREKKYTYSDAMKEAILLATERNSCNLLIDKTNKRNYERIAISKGIHCRINGVQY